MSTNNNRDETIAGYSISDIIHSFNDFDNHFILGQLLLKGGQGSIYATAAKQSKLKQNNRTYKKKEPAWKLITKRVKLSGEHALDTKIKCVQEYILQRKLNMIHYNGISYGHTRNKDEILLTMEMLEYSLLDAIDFKIDEHIHDFQCIKSDYGLKYFILEVTSFLHQLHSLGYVHLDIKPDNIMFRNKRNEHSLMYGNGWKVIDLGLTECIGINTNDDSICIPSYVGTIGYSAPEIDPFTDSECPSKVSYKADIWSLGVVILYLINGYNIFDIKSRDKEDDDGNYHKYIEYKNKLMNCDWVNSHVMNLYLNNKINFYLYDLLSQCLEYDVNKRLSAREVLKHPLFTGMVFESKSDSELYCYRNQYRKITKSKAKHSIPFVSLTKKIRI